MGAAAGVAVAHWGSRLLVARHGRRVSGAAARSAHARVHRGRRPHRGARLRRGAGVARDPRRAHRRDEGSRTDAWCIEPHTDGERPRPGAGRPLARAPRRRRPVPAVVQRTDAGAARLRARSRAARGDRRAPRRPRRPRVWRPTSASTSAFLRFRASSRLLSRSRRRSARCGAGASTSPVRRCVAATRGTGPRVSGSPIVRFRTVPLAVFNGITPGWIATFGTPLLAGRDISERDGRARLAWRWSTRPLPGSSSTARTPSGTRFTRRGNPDRPRSRSSDWWPMPSTAMCASRLPTAYVPLSQSVDSSWWRTPR